MCKLYFIRNAFTRVEADRGKTNKLFLVVFYVQALKLQAFMLQLYHIILAKKEQNNSIGEKFGDSSDATSPTDKLYVYPSLIAFYHE